MKGRKAGSNTQQVFQYLMQHGPATAPDIAANARLPLRDVANSVLRNPFIFVKDGKERRGQRSYWRWSVWEE